VGTEATTTGDPMNCPHCQSADIRPSANDLYNCHGCGVTIGNYFPEDSPPTDVIAIAESYRQRMGLRPWAEYAALSPAPPRRTGRTMRGLLEALAQCQLMGGVTLYIDGGPSVLSSYCRDMASDVRDHLGLKQKIVLYRNGIERGKVCVVYTDHVANDSDASTWQVRNRPDFQREHLGTWVPFVEPTARNPKRYQPVQVDREALRQSDAFVAQLREKTEAAVDTMLKRCDDQARELFRTMEPIPSSLLAECDLLKREAYEVFGVSRAEAMLKAPMPPPAQMIPFTDDRITESQATEYGQRLRKLMDEMGPPLSRLRCQGIRDGAQCSATTPVDGVIRHPWRCAACAVPADPLDVVIDGEVLKALIF